MAILNAKEKKKKKKKKKKKEMVEGIKTDLKKRKGGG